MVMNKLEQKKGTKASYADLVKEIAFKTFETTCYMFPLGEWELDDSEDMEKPDGSIRAIVEFDGATDGGLVISTTPHLLESIAANMLGIEAPSREVKEGALGEIANIICGNTVPGFAHNNEICYIRPPRIARESENFDEIYKDKASEHVEVILDEGIAHITIYYKAEANR